MDLNPTMGVEICRFTVAWLARAVDVNLRSEGHALGSCYWATILMFNNEVWEMLNIPMQKVLCYDGWRWREEPYPGDFPLLYSRLNWGI